MPANRKFEAHGRAQELSPVRKAAGWIGSWPRRAAVLAVRAYQRLIAPWLPAVFGANAGCRFYPSCSHYAVEALERHGFFAGVYLAARRLLRCQPLHPGGLDPVPENFRWLPPSERRLHLFAPATTRRATPHHG